MKFVILLTISILLEIVLSFILNILLKKIIWFKRFFKPLSIVWMYKFSKLLTIVIRESYKKFPLLLLINMKKIVINFDFVPNLFAMQSNTLKKDLFFIIQMN